MIFVDNSSILFLRISKYFSSLSIRIYLLSFNTHACPVVPVPAKVSSTKSPGLECLSRISDIRPNGFCVG